MQRASDKTAYIRFDLPEQDEDGAVSVVGSFNDWTPGAHEMHADDDGGMSVVIEVPYGTEIHFRYLGDGGRWFDDPDAAEHDGRFLVDDDDDTNVNGEDLTTSMDADGTAAETGSGPQEDASVLDLTTGHVGSQINQT